MASEPAPVRADATTSAPKPKMARTVSPNYARGLNRAIVIATGVWCLGLAATIAAQATMLSQPAPVALESAVAGTNTVDTIEKTSEWSAFIADAMRTPALLAASALAAIAIGSLVVVSRSTGGRAGAATIALGVYGALALNRSELLGILDVASPSIAMIAMRTVFLVACALLSWRWMDDISLGAALTPAEDPHGIDAATDREAANVGREGAVGRDRSSRRLQVAMATDEPGLHGHGSPIPRTMPDDD
jgi:hypothetical protein